MSITQNNVDPGSQNSSNSKSEIIKFYDAPWGAGRNKEELDDRIEESTKLPRVEDTKLKLRQNKRILT